MHTFFKRRLRQVLVGSIIFTVGLVSFLSWFLRDEGLPIIIENHRKTGMKDIVISAGRKKNILSLLPPHSTTTISVQFNGYESVQLHGKDVQSGQIIDLEVPRYRSFGMKEVDLHILLFDDGKNSWQTTLKESSALDP